MATGAIRIDWFPRDALDGMQALTPMEELAYRRLLDLLYVSGGELADDPKRLGWMTKTGKQWPKIRESLLDMGKIEVRDGVLSNPKCSALLGAMETKIGKKSLAGKASAEKRKVLKKHKTTPTPVGTSVPTDAQQVNQRSQLVIESESINDRESHSRERRESHRAREDHAAGSRAPSTDMVEDPERVPPRHPPEPRADRGHLPSPEETARAVALLEAAKSGFRDAGLTIARPPTSKEIGAARGWDASGADPELVRMVAKGIGARFAERSEPAPSLAYLDNPIREALTAPAPTTLPTTGGPRHEPTRPHFDRHASRTDEARRALAHVADARTLAGQ